LSNDSSLPKPPSVSTPTAYAILLVNMVIWASSFAAIRFVLRQTDAMTMTALRLFVAAGCMGVVIAVFNIPLPRRDDWPGLSAAALLGFSVYHYLLNLGTETVTAGQASFIVATIPIWTALLAWHVLDEYLSPKNWLGLALGLVGVGSMSLDFSGGIPNIGIGSWLVLGAALSAGANIVITKDLLARYRPIDIAAYAACIGALPFLLHVPWTWTASAELATSGWLALLYLGVVPIGLGYWLNSIALAALPAHQVAQMLLLIPPMAALIAWVTIGETPPMMLLVGGPLIVTGVLLGQRKP